MNNLPYLDYGSWKTRDWKGAILSLEELEVLDAENRIYAIQAFIKQVFGWYQISYLEPDG